MVMYDKEKYEAVDGDYNSNESNTEYKIVASSGENCFLSVGDINGDGIIPSTDHLLLKAHFNGTKN